MTSLPPITPIFMTLPCVHWLWAPTMDYVILGMACHIQGFEKPWVLFLVDFACILQLKKWKKLKLGLKLAHLRTLKHYVDHSWITTLISFRFCLLFELSLSSSHKPLCSINSHLPLHSHDARFPNGTSFECAPFVNSNQQHKRIHSYLMQAFVHKFVEDFVHH